MLKPQKERTFEKLYEGPVVIYLSDRDDLRVEWIIDHECDEQFIAKYGLNAWKIPKGKTLKIFGFIDQSYCFCERCEQSDVYTSAEAEEELKIKTISLIGMDLTKKITSFVCPECEIDYRFVEKQDEN